MDTSQWPLVYSPKQELSVQVREIDSVQVEQCYVAEASQDDVLHYNGALVYWQACSGPVSCPIHSAVGMRLTDFAADPTSTDQQHLHLGQLGGQLWSQDCGCMA